MDNDKYLRDFFFCFLKMETFFRAARESKIRRKKNGNHKDTFYGENGIEEKLIVDKKFNESEGGDL